jgi:hypothetical protein
MNHCKARHIGLDAGVKGAIAWLDANGNFLGCEKMPVNGENDTDFMALARLLRLFPKDAHIVTEQLSALYGVGAKQTFSFARQCAILECAILVNKLSWTKVNPKKWQAKIWIGQKMIMKEVKLDNEGTKKFKTDTKKISENTFIKLFPCQINDKKILLRSGRLHDGIVDAALLALYGKRESL